MKSFNKLVVAIIVISWMMLVAYVVAVELLMLDASSWFALGIVGLVGLIFSHGYFFFVFLKNRKRIDSLKEQYLDTLKPKFPLRFCPSDDELMDAYFVSKDITLEPQESSKEKTNENTDEKTLEEEEELEI